MSDISLALVALASDAAVKFAVLALVVELLGRRLHRAAPAVANRLWAAVLAAGALLPVILWLTPATVLIQPSAAVVNRMSTGFWPASSAAIAVTLLGAGTIVFFVRLAIGLVAIRRLIVSSSVVSGAETEDLRRMSGVRSGRTRCCLFASHPSLAVPVTVGYWRPWILLPADWRTWSASRLSAVMAHEGAHVDRGDYLAGISATLFRAVWWWHPAAWLAVSRLQLTAELACDARASASDSRADYASHLLDLARTAGGRRVRYGWTLGATSRLRQRVDALIDDRTAAHPLTVHLRASIIVMAIFLTWAAAPIRFTLSRTAVSASELSFDHDATHGAMHALGRGRH